MMSAKREPAGAVPDKVLYNTSLGTQPDQPAAKRTRTDAMGIDRVATEQRPP
jgi:hypothetical protein